MKTKFTILIWFTAVRMFAAAAAALSLMMTLSACTEEGPQQGVLSSLPIAFKAEDLPDGEAVPSSEGTRAFAKNSKIYVYADYYAAYDDAENAANSFSPHENTPVTLSSTDGKTWNYESALAYWPSSGYLAFYAYYPYRSAGNGISVTTDNSTGKPTLTYVNTDASVDLSVTPWNIYPCPESSTNSVPLTFQHLMGKLNFAFKRGSDNAVTFKVSGINFNSSNNDGNGNRTDVVSRPVVEGWNSITLTHSRNTNISKTTTATTIKNTTPTAIDALTCYLVPGTIISEVNVTIDGVSKTCTLATPVEMAANHQVTITIVVSATDGEFKIDAFPSWTAGGIIDGTLS